MSGWVEPAELHKRPVVYLRQQLRRQHTLLLVEERLIDGLDDPHSKLAQPAWQLFMLRNMCKLQFQNALAD